ncbi:hypothetical protein FE633_11490 [Streptomyces montanus]|uniref:Uncharacterized protein n=1 Tax=Streptomyces montanus TaxID=2580423 RepID=A0A5R9FRZ8_9ACTN|nr:hypothetical protein [Streptomyces montanus]TLS46151.1 hypothetical protein FE633_11490 [Streptomyces montanus]
MTGYPLVAVRHGRREDRAVVYDRFLSLCLCFYGLRRDRCDPSKRGEDASALEDGIPVLVDELHAALYAIELRAPAEVRETARHLFWRICGW